jgi:hypothetical protein
MEVRQRRIVHLTLRPSRFGMRKLASALTSESLRREVGPCAKSVLSQAAARREIQSGGKHRSPKRSLVV